MFDLTWLSDRAGFGASFDMWRERGGEHAGSSADNGGGGASREGQQGRRQLVVSGRETSRGEMADNNLMEFRIERAGMDGSKLARKVFWIGGDWG